MNKKEKLLTVTTILTAVLANIQSASAHLEPKKGEDVEKCYGVVEAGKNECASKVNKHSCATMARADRDPNEWIKVPKGICDKLVGGSTEPKDEG